MLSKINNNLFQKNANIALVAREVWLNPGTTRVDISRRLNLYRSTVTNITSFLIDSGVVKEEGAGESLPQGGRKPIRLSVDSEFAVAVGIDIQPSHYRIAVLDMYGRPLWEKVGKASGSSLEDMVSETTSLALDEAERLGVPVLGVCFGLPGVHDIEKGLIRYSEPLGVEDYDFRSMFAKRFDVPVLIENDANCAAWHELTAHTHAADENMIVIYGDWHDNSETNESHNGIGVGLGIALGGKVYRGSHFSAGEFCSLSWRAWSKGQTGFTGEDLAKVRTDSAMYRLWMGDLFNSLISLVAVLDPKCVVMHGDPFLDEEGVRRVISEVAPGFSEVAERYGCDFVFHASDCNVVAKGAATVLLHSLFSLPSMESVGSVLFCDWEKRVAEVNGRRRKG